MIHFYDIFFDSVEETNTYEIKSRRLRSQMGMCYFFSFIFKKNHGFIDNPLEKVVIFEGELDGIDTDNIRN